MKKTLAIVSFIFMVFVTATAVHATPIDGPECQQAGGTCQTTLTGVGCIQPATFIGYFDCPEETDMYGIVYHQLCCKYNSSNCAPDTSPCKFHSDCCSNLCAYNSHQKGYICEAIATSIPIIPTPAPPINIRGNCKPGEINTALGCIPANDLNDFVGWILGKLIFVASGIAFLLMAFGALQILTSAGSPEKVKAGQELITSALSGLLFIILSLFLLKLIGVDILHIPGFGT